MGFTVANTATTNLIGSVIEVVLHSFDQLIQLSFVFSIKKIIMY